MSRGPKDPKLNYDEFDKGSPSEKPCVRSDFIQIDLPSTRIEVPSDHLLFTDIDGERTEVKAKNIKKNDLLYMIRDDKKVTERVLEVKEVYCESLTESEVKDGMLILNNVLTRQKKTQSPVVPITPVGDK